MPVTEEAHAADKDSASPDAWPAFHGYGVSGDVTGQVVYANYGRPEDFEALERLGVSVKGKVVLARYGALFRGLKVLNAQRRGAIGVLIYSDPADDGYMKGDVYPNGPYRPGSAIQRGSVQFLSLGPGDPSTPGTAVGQGRRSGCRSTRSTASPPPPVRPAEPGTASFVANAADSDAVADWERDDRTQAARLLRRDPLAADQLRRRPADPRGTRRAERPRRLARWACRFAYHVGPGPAEVQFAITMDYKIRPIWNVIATIQGSVEPDRWVLISNHRDAWTYGAVDPASGTPATLEACRALGAAVKDGWKPRRTLVYASWDAEEYGLVGSTEWAEEHEEELKREGRPDAQRRLGRRRPEPRGSTASRRSATCSSRPPPT